MEKQVGMPCPDCGTPLIQGNKGPYCKPCYIAWANKNKPKTSSTARPISQQPTKEEWQDIGMKKARTVIAVAYIRAGRLYEESLDKEQWMQWIEQGTDPF